MGKIDIIFLNSWIVSSKYQNNYFESNFKKNPQRYLHFSHLIKHIINIHPSHGIPGCRHLLWLSTPCLHFSLLICLPATDALPTSLFGFLNDSLLKQAKAWCCQDTLLFLCFSKQGILGCQMPFLLLILYRLQGSGAGMCMFQSWRGRRQLMKLHLTDCAYI